MGYLGLLIGYLVIWTTPVLGLWHKRFSDMGKRPWSAFVPFYNYYQLLRATQLPRYWVLFLLFPGAQFIVWASLNVTYIRKFGEFGVKETVLGILFPFPVFAAIARKREKYPVATPTNWEVAKQVDARTPSDHVALFFSLPVVAHLIVIPLSLLSTKRKPGKKSVVKEWGDVILFALVAASTVRTYIFEPYKIPTGSMENTLLVGDQLFVNKFTYGARIPMTPFSFPLVNNSFAPILPIKSYVGIQKIPFTRLPGLRDVERNDVVVFNFPSGDTAINDPRMPNGLIGHDYHALLRNEALFTCLYRDGRDLDFFEENYPYYLNITRKQFEEEGKIYTAMVDREDVKRGYTAFDGLLSRPVDKRENYIKRCVAIPGDTLHIVDQLLYINGEKAYQPKDMKMSGRPLPLGSYDIARRYAEWKAAPERGWNLSYCPIFPNDRQYNWTEDNFGPIRIPKAGDHVRLTPQTIPLYRRIIQAYEGHELTEREDGIYIDGRKTDRYTIEMDYYWMMGDNRNGSADSRYWGFVPEDHIVGHAAFTWLSTEPEKGLLGGGMRWERLFNRIR